MLRALSASSDPLMNDARAVFKDLLEKYKPGERGEQEKVRALGRPVHHRYRATRISGV